MAHFDLVFEGGGAKGSVFAGALEVFFAAGHQPARLVGTSAGAITAALLAAGYSPTQMLEAVNEQRDGKPRFASFMDVPAESEFDPQMKAESQLQTILNHVDIPGVPAFLENRIDAILIDRLLAMSPHFRQLFGFVECGGLFSGRTFVEWLNEKLEAHQVPRGCTLGQMNADKGCDLSLVVTDTTNRQMRVLNHRTAPSVPVAMAVRMSMSIPFVWREVTWQKEWGTYCGADITDARIVDGGVLSNFPMDLIACSDDRIRKIMGERADPTAAFNLGMLIDENIAVPGIDAKPVRDNPLRTVRRVQRMVDTMTGARDNALMDQFSDQVCRLPAKGYGTTEFDMPKAKIDALVEAGRAAMR
ncbi:MAG: patatin-like phospholipase family protein, partial [Candidatus Solibacter sp.]